MSEKKNSYAGRESEHRACIQHARDARFATTGEPSLAPDLDDAVAARAEIASKGSKSGKK